MRCFFRFPGFFLYLTTHNSQLITNFQGSMDKCDKQLVALVKDTYIRQGLESIQSRGNLLKSLLSDRHLPLHGFDESTIEYFMQQFAMMDSNNFLGNVGFGEREGRVFSSLIARRHYHLSHGIGRSGDIAEQQPKAAGSSVIYKLTNYLALHAMHIVGFTGIEKALVVPLATGMSVALSLLTLKQTRPMAKYVIWTRIDQKSCFKAILTCGLTPIIIENVINGDEIVTNIESVEQAVAQHGAENILCILSTTSCFAPRRPDRVDALAKICKDHNIAHIINNAYGLQCPLIAKLVNRAISVGRVDYIVQSLDKNFLMPVGGAIIASPTGGLIKLISKVYPGRASSTPIVDLFLTLLAMGETSWRGLQAERLRLLPIFIDGLQRVALEFGERVLVSPCNSISVGVTLSQSLLRNDSPETAQKAAQYIGSMLFKRSVSGSRVIVPSASSMIGEYAFPGWGSNVIGYHSVYMTAACAIGLQEHEIHTFLTKLTKVFTSVRKAYVVPGHVEARLVGEKQQQGGEEEQQQQENGRVSELWVEAYNKKAKHL
jgi:O-phospho-L-seryl-tRNASec:L-selenocysteinyl-tRNA synthase